MAFLADENVPRPIVARLRAEGLTVGVISETKAGIPDTDVLAVASERGVVLITQDQDFGELVVLRQLPVAGVILLALERLPLEAQVERAALCITADPLGFAGKLTVIEPARVRVRSLPASSP